MLESSPVLRLCHCFCCDGVSIISIHLFAAVCDLVFDFDRSLERDATPELAQTCVHNGCSCNAITSFAAGDGFLVVAILQAIIPGILDGQCLCGPRLVGLQTVEPEEECPLLALSSGHPHLGASSLGPTCNHLIGHTALGPCTMGWVPTELFFFADMALATATAPVVAK